MLKDYPFLTLAPLSKFSWPYMWGFILFHLSIPTAVPHSRLLLFCSRTWSSPTLFILKIVRAILGTLHHRITLCNVPYWTCLYGFCQYEVGFLSITFSILFLLFYWNALLLYVNFISTNSSELLLVLIVCLSIFLNIFYSLLFCYNYRQLFGYFPILFSPLVSLY